MEFKHYSVLLEETIENLNVRPGGIYVDGTLGGGGHAYEVCKRLNGQGRFIGIDQDADAIKAAGERLSEYGDLVTIVRSNYCNMKQVLNDLGIEKVDGIVLDLGVSSFQLDTPEGGFTVNFLKRYYDKVILLALFVLFIGLMLSVLSIVETTSRIKPEDLKLPDRKPDHVIEEQKSEKFKIAKLWENKSMVWNSGAKGVETASDLIKAEKLAVCPY